MGRPVLPQIESFLQAGIDPKTKLPLKFIDAQEGELKNNIKRVLRIVDAQDAINRYTWHNIPCELSSQEFERLIYYKGQLCFFYFKELDKFFLMPYALDGSIDFYGRYNTIHPVPFTSGEESKEEKEIRRRQEQVLSTLKLNVQYDVAIDEVEDPSKYCVLIHDYTKQLGQRILPRAILNEPIIDLESEIMPYMRTSLILGTGIQGIRVDDGDQWNSVNEAARSMKHAALNGKGWIPITSPIELQELTPGQVAKAEEYLLAMQAIDNFRLSTYGLQNGGLFEKKAHELESEAALNKSTSDVIYQDGLSIRQHFCDVVNSLFGVGIWVEANQSAINLDNDMDGLDYETENTEGGDYDESNSDL